MEIVNPTKKFKQRSEVIEAVKLLKTEKQINLAEMMLVGSAAAIAVNIDTVANDLDFAVQKDYFAKMKAEFPESLVVVDYTQDGIAGYQSRKIEVIRFKINDYLFEFWENYLVNPFTKRVEEGLCVATLATQIQHHLVMGLPKNKEMLGSLIERMKTVEYGYYSSRDVRGIWLPQPF